MSARDLQHRVSVFILSIDRDALFLDKLLDGCEITVAYGLSKNDQSSEGDPGVPVVLMRPVDFSVVLTSS